MTKLVRSFCILGALVGFIPFRELAAQGVTSAAVVGRVTDDAGQPIPSGSLTLTNTASGVRYLARSADDGRFFFENVQVGAYVLDARALGHEPGRVPDIVLTLGQRRVADVTLRRAAVQLGGVTVEAVADPLRSTSRTGASQFVSESLIARLPTLARNFTDFVETTPQIARTSAAGQNNRFNNIQIDGAVNNDLFGLGSTGQPGGQVNAKTIPLDAISQYQVLIAPFDVRQGGFTGGLINAVTRRGTNQIHGSLFEYHQGNDFVGDGLTGQPFGTFTENQYGGSVGGPLFKDKLHLFLAGEGQGRNRPNSGANIGIDPVTATGINPDSAARFTNIFRSNYSAFDPGGFGQVSLENPNTNLFGRLDWQVAPNHLLTVRHNYVKASDVSTTRGNNYAWASNNFQIRNVTNSSVLEFHSTFGGRLFNELILGRETIRDKRDPNVAFPQVQVTVTSDTSPTPNPAGRFTRTLVAGAEQFSQANRLDQDIYELTDNVTFGLSGGHRLTLGTHNEFFHFTNLFIGQFTGLWTFTSLANFQSGTASSFTRTLPYPGTSTPIADFRVRQFGFYVQDQWDATPRLNLTYGVRLDVPTFPDHPRSNPDAQSVFQVNTQDVPSGNLLWSPRVGFNYDVTGDRNTVLRGGVGLFTGRPAYVWLSNAYGNSGRETVQLSCVNVAGRSDSVPAFTLDPSNQPSLCRNQTSLTATGLQTVNYFDKDFKFPQVWKADVAVDRDLPHGFLGTFEVLYSRTANAMLIRDRNIGAVASYARDGRPIYGTISGTGVVTTNFVDARFDKVLEHYNGGGDWSVSFTWQLQRRFANWLEANAAYTYQHVEDRISLTSSIASSNYAFDPIRFDPNNPEQGISSFNIPHKVTLNGTMNLPWHLQLSFVYIGRTGSPYSYIYQGDANADGYPNRSGSVRGENDLVYVPRNQSDILLQTPSQWAALDAYISGEPCLEAARGSILKRNACQEPWRHIVNARLVGDLPTVAGQHAQAVLEVFNLLNLMNRHWGLQQNATNATVRLLQLRGWDAATNQGIFSFVNPSLNPVDDTNSRWKMQFGVRYTF